MTQLEFTFILLIIYQVKQFLADFPLQNSYMLRKISPDWDFVVPLALHSSVHASFSLLICGWANPALWWLCLFDFVAHFSIDRIKASPRLLGRFGRSQGFAYWTTFGADQMAHHLTHLVIVWILVQAKT